MHFKAKTHTYRGVYCITGVILHNNLDLDLEPFIKRASALTRSGAVGAVAPRSYLSPANSGAASSAVLSLPVGRQFGR